MTDIKSRLLMLQIGIVRAERTGDCFVVTVPSLRVSREYRIRAEERDKTAKLHAKGNKIAKEKKER